MLHDGKPQSGAARFLRVALVHPVEPLEHPPQVAPGDADLLWTLELQVPLGSSAELILTGPAGVIGSVRTDENGKRVRVSRKTGKDL